MLYMKLDNQKTILKKFAFLACLMGLAACNNLKLISKKNPPLSMQHQNHLLVATSDYHSGALLEISLTQQQTEVFEIPIHSDAIVRAVEDGSLFYVVNRLGADNIEWGSRENRQIIGQFSVGRGTNPQDIAVLSPRIAYISRLSSNRLLKVNPETGEFLKEIDLFATADSKTINSTDSDGLPEMTWMKTVGQKLWIVLQRLKADKDYEPSNKSQVAVLDTAKDRVDKIVTLKGTNPVTDFKQLGTEFLLGEAGKLGILDGGIELFDADLNSQGWVTTEEQLGGDVIDSALIDSDRGLAIVAKDIYGSKPKTQLICFEKRDGRVTSIIKDSGIYSLQQILVDEARNIFYLSDRDPRRPGVWGYNSKTLQPLHETFYETGLPPYHMVLVP